MSTMLRVIKHCKLRLLSPLYAQCVYFFAKEKGKRNHQKAIKKPNKEFISSEIWTGFVFKLLRTAIDKQQI